MTTDRVRRAIALLRWVLGVVILAQAARFAFSRSAAAEFAKTGMPDFVHLALAWGEMAAAALFLIPAFVTAGGRLLIAILGCAMVLHLLHGWLDVGVLVVYAAATWTVLAANAQNDPEPAKERTP
jgi:hypothetical protein